MGVTIHYRGKMADLGQVEELEDRVLDLAFELGATAQVWRSAADDSPDRIVRGLILDLSPGQETMSLLISPEGWLFPLHDIEEAERGPLPEPPLCFVKTQYGSLEGHVALTELLRFLKQKFFPNLQVDDEGEYWESGDFRVLAEKFARVRTAMQGMVEGLAQFGLSREAAEDRNILATRIERIARLVQQTLQRSPEPARPEGDGDVLSEREWDAMYRQHRRRQERLHRAIEEQLQQGIDHARAFENALSAEGIGEAPQDAETDAPDDDISAGLPDDEPWRESLPGEVWEDEPSDLASDASIRERHPLQRVASDLRVRAHQLFTGAGSSVAVNVQALEHGLGEISGGLAQAFALQRWRSIRRDRGWELVQFKRAWRGTAFAKGALIPLAAAGLIDKSDYEDFRDALQQLTEGILEEITQIREGA